MDKRKLLAEVLSPIALELNEGETRLTGLQLMPLGEWSHPSGKISMTIERARSFAEGFQKHLAGQRLPILYIHSSKENVSNPLWGKAAGWIINMRADDVRGLLIDVDFTKAGAEAVRNKEYSYLSAEYFDRVQLPHHKRSYKDVMIGAALVNRPHLKGMDPILNAETGHQFFFEVQADEGGGPMDPILLQLAKAAGIELTEDATELTDEQRSSFNTFLTDQTAAVADAEKALKENVALKQRVTELEDPTQSKARSLEEAGFGEEAKLLAELAAERTLQQFGGMLPGGHVYTKTVKAKLKEFAEGHDLLHLREAFELVVSGKGMVDTRELGSSGGNDGEETDPGAELNKLAAARAKDDKITLAEAQDLIIEEKPELYEAHERLMRRAVILGGEA